MAIRFLILKILSLDLRAIHCSSLVFVSIVPEQLDVVLKGTVWQNQGDHK